MDVPGASDDVAVAMDGLCYVDALDGFPATWQGLDRRDQGVGRAQEFLVPIRLDGRDLLLEYGLACLRVRFFLDLLDRAGQCAIVAGFTLGSAT